MCTHIIAVHNTAQNSFDNFEIFPLILQTITIAQMMSTGGDGEHFTCLL